VIGVSAGSAGGQGARMAPEPHTRPASRSQGVTLFAQFFDDPLLHVGGY
jgi:hypothetical protein